MGLIRGGLLFIVGVLFLGALISGGLFYTLQSSLKYENIKPTAVALIEDTLEEEYNLSSEVEARLGEMDSSCENNTEFVFYHNDSGETFVIPCDVVANGTEAIVNHGVDSVFDEVYNSSSDCDSGVCSVVSKEARGSWDKRFYYALISLVVLFVLIWLFVERKANSLIMAGGIMVLASLPFLAIDSFANFFVEKQVADVFVNLLSGANFVFGFLLTFGLILAGVGIGLRLWKFDFSKRKFSKNEVRKIARDEMKKK